MVPKNPGVGFGVLCVLFFFFFFFLRGRHVSFFFFFFFFFLNFGVPNKHVVGYGVLLLLVFLIS